MCSFFFLEKKKSVNSPDAPPKKIFYQEPKMNTQTHLERTLQDKERYLTEVLRGQAPLKPNLTNNTNEIRFHLKPILHRT